MGKRLRQEGKMSEDEVKAEIARERQKMVDELTNRTSKSAKMDLRDQH